MSVQILNVPLAAEQTVEYVSVDWRGLANG